LVTILIDATDITNLSGSRTAVYELYDSVFQLKKDWNFLILVSKEEESLNKYPQVRQIIIPSNNRILQRVFVQLTILKYDLTKKINIVHFARSIGGITITAKNILTVFDVTSLVYPEYYPKMTYIYWKYLAPFFLSRSDKIIAISHTVKNDLINYYHLMDNKIDVVYCAPKMVFAKKPEPEEINRVREKYSLPSKYLLYLGILAKKKNLSTLLNALYVLKRKNIEFPPLVIAGGSYRKSDDYATIVDLTFHNNMANDVIILGTVEDRDIVGLFHGASIFLYPSLHEGFGIPCLEAMMCGIPVITTNSGAIPEIVGDAAIIVRNPLDPELFADMILLLLKDINLRQELIMKGFDRALKFNWENSAKKILEIFEAVIE
jgi:glycosyltransferase involved in cell wall biosynthesis